jgi:uncharacterized damage-inducible protein DinB
MANEITRLEEQLRRSFEGEAWHGPSVLDALRDVTPEMACAHPVAAAHSIWELVLHLGGAYRLVLRRLEGKDAPLTAVEDWPPVPVPTDTDWQDAVHTLRELNRQLRSAVLRFRLEELDEPLVASSPYSAYVQFIGVTQHDLYHAGQIAILKKTLPSGDPRREAEQRP